MNNFGENEFNYDTFKLMYDSNEKIQNLVKDFDDHGIRLNTQKDQDQESDQSNFDQSGERISNTASKAAEKSLNDRHSRPFK